ALVAAALFGSWTRWGNRQDRPSREPSSLNALVGLRLPDDAVIDEVSSESVPGVRLRLAECRGPAFLFLIPIESTSTAEVLANSFTSLDYRMVDVYRGEIQPEWNQVNRVYDYVVARAEALYWTKSHDDDGFYVRIYIGADCRPAGHVLIDWANTVLAQWL
ncbi:MAG TPA: hypothetical protein VEH77_11040, partial [Roseiarcus sp.]|nr:hypothetical protein [Roseiarcus sp.]